MTPNGCTLWPDVVLGVDIRPCCDAHDLSDLGLGASLELGRCVVQRGIDSGSPAVEALFIIMAVAMAAATALFARMVRRIGEARKDRQK